jgi:hypothetical protein
MTICPFDLNDNHTNSKSSKCIRKWLLRDSAFAICRIWTGGVLIVWFKSQDSILLKVIIEVYSLWVVSFYRVKGRAVDDTLDSTTRR